MRGPTTFFSKILGGVAPYLPKLAIRYNSTPATYLGGYATGANVISVTTIVPDGTPSNKNANTGLGYDFIRDLIFVKELLTKDTICFDRTLTEVYRMRAGGMASAGYGTQGVTYDPDNDVFIDYFNDSIQEYRRSDGFITLAQSAVAPPGYVSGGCFYNPFTKVLSLSSQLSTHLVNYKKIGGVWTQIDTTWYTVPEGIGYDFITDKALANGGSVQERDFLTGMSIRNFVKPDAGTKAVVEGIIGDPKDGSFWFNSDQYYHGLLPGKNELWHTDQRGWYQQYLRFPDMIPFSMWKLGAGASVTGSYNGEVLHGYVFSKAPIINYGIRTGQQSLSNYFVYHGTEKEVLATSFADFEFRGSNTAPTTTVTNYPAYLPLSAYNANSSNDGWGSTVPSAWQSTPGTWQYMQKQVRPKPQSPATPAATPLSIIGPTNCKLWLELFSTQNMVIDPDNNQIYQIPNKARMNDLPFANLELGMFEQTSSGSQGVFSTDKVNFAVGKYMEMLHMSEISGDQQGELVAVFRRTAAGSFGIPFAASDPASNNNQLRFLHLRSSDSPANVYDLDIVDGAGTLSRAQTAADNNTVHKMVCWNSDGTTLRQYVNKVLQTTTMNPGTNNGPWIGDFAITKITIGSLLRLSGAITGSTDVRLIVYANRVLTTQERSDLYDYCVNKGLI